MAANIQLRMRVKNIAEAGPAPAPGSDGPQPHVLVNLQPLDAPENPTGVQIPFADSAAAAQFFTVGETVTVTFAPATA